MANVAWGKKILAVAVLSCLCASIAVPAYAFYYVHGEENVAATSKGVIEVTCTVDETAQGGREDLAHHRSRRQHRRCLPGRERGFQQQSERPCGHSRLQRLQLGGRAVRQAVHVHGAQGRQPEAGHAHRVRRKRHRGARARRSSASTAWCSRWRNPPRGVRTTSRAPHTSRSGSASAPLFFTSRPDAAPRRLSTPSKADGRPSEHHPQRIIFYYPRSNVCASSAKP